MTQQLEHPWVGEIFNAEELKEYRAFEQEMKTSSNAQQKEAFEQDWYQLVQEIERNLDVDPKSAIGIRLGGRCMDLINGLYGPKYAHLRTKKFEKGFGEGKGLKETGLTQETVVWLDKAIDAYWRDRIYRTFAKVENQEGEDLVACFQTILEEMYGDQTERQKSLIPIILDDKTVSEKVKIWLKKHFS